jgi:hypothetical protein
MPPIAGLQLIWPSVSMLCVSSSVRAAHARGRQRGLGAGMAAADHDDVESSLKRITLNPPLFRGAYFKPRAAMPTGRPAQLATKDSTATGMPANFPAPRLGPGVVHRLAVRTHRDGDRHVAHLEFVHRLHAEFGKGDHAARADGVRHQEGGAAHRDQVGGAVLARWTRRFPGRARPCRPSPAARFAEHGVGEAIHAIRGGRTRGTHDFVPTGSTGPT